MDEELFYEIVDGIDYAYSNLFLYAIKNRVNIKSIVDKAVKQVEDYIDNRLEFVPTGFEGLLFMSVVAKMLDKSLYDLVCITEVERECLLLQIIDRIDISKIYDYEEDEEENEISFCYDIDFLDNEGKEVCYELYFKKKYGFAYEIRVGLYCDSEYGFTTDYMDDDYVLWDEPWGRVEDFFDDVIECFSKKEENTIIDYKDFFIHSDERDCNHDYIKVMATVPVNTTSGVETISFIADYCAECGVYYIPESVYMNVIVPAGRLLCQLVTIDEYKKYRKEQRLGGKLKPQSILNMLGYNVNSKTNLSEKERHTIIKYAIESKLTTKNSTISLLKQLILLAGNKNGMDKPIKKWKIDLQWVYDFDLKGDIIYGVRKIITEEEHNKYLNDSYGFMNIPEGILNDLPFK